MKNTHVVARERMDRGRFPTAVSALDRVLPTKPTTYPEPFASRVAGREKRPLGDLFGLANFGVNITRLPLTNCDWAVAFSVGPTSPCRLLLNNSERPL